MKAEVPAAVDALARSSSYAAELRKLRERETRVGRKAREQDGLLLRDWDHDLSEDIPRELARSVPRGDYELGPVTARQAVIGGKTRTLYRASITDTLVLGVVAHAWSVLLESVLNTRLFSYRAGRSGFVAVREFAAYLQAHRAERADPRQRGLFVLRRDVARYGESIPVTDDAPLFALLDTTFAKLELPPEHFLARLVRAAVRPLVIQNEGEAPAPLERGVPTGSPIQPSICNLYLTSLDAALSAIPGAFYARFGDDLLFAHPDPSIARSASASIETELTRLGLTLKAEKTRDYYFTGAGRRHPEWTGTQYIEYLGVRIDFTGAIGLTRAKARRLQQALTQRIDNAVRVANPKPDEALTLAAQITARALDVRLAISDPLLGLLYHAVNDGSQLRHIDYLFARTLAQRLSRKRGVRAFRSYSYRALRRAGMPSLVHLKNLAMR